MDFRAKTLARSRTHRLMWLVYLGAAAAVLLNSSLIDGALFARSQGWSKALRFLVLYWPLASSVVLFPIALRVLGWPMALRMTVLQLLVSLSIFEALFYSWQKLPFTCSYVPAERPLVGVVAQYVVLLGAMAPILAVVIVVAIQVLFLFPFFLAIFGGLWIFLRVRRREGWGEAKLMYEDLPAVVADLGIREITYAGCASRSERSAFRPTMSASPQ